MTTTELGIDCEAKPKDKKNDFTETTALPESPPVSDDQAVQHFGEKDSDEFPEGGRGWLVIVGTCLVLTFSFGMVNSFGQYQLYYEKKFPDANSAVISLIGSLQPTVMYITALPLTALVHATGINGSMMIGSGLMVVAFMMISLCDKLWQFYLAQGVLFGIGAGIVFLTAMAMPAEWFKRRRALALGITAAGSSIGGSLWPIALSHLIAKVGFGWANRIIGFIYIPFMGFASLAVKSRMPNVNKESLWLEWSVCRDWRFVTISVGYCVGLMGLFPPLFFVSSYAEVLGMPDNIVKYILTIINAVSFIGRVGPSFIADKVGRMNMLVPCVALIGILQYALWIPAKSEGVLLTFAVLWGIASGSYIALLPPAIGQLFGIKGNRSRLNICFLIGAPGCLAGPTIAGAFIPAGTDSIEPFKGLIAYSGSMMVLAALLFLVVRLSYTRKLFVFI